jgi:8-oxo-dGTP pyrophosphatase MutT (NUDIX family)
MLLREETGAEAFSVLMLERHGSMDFPGAHAFPGGLVDASDADFADAALPSTQRWAAVGEGDRPPEAIVYWIAALRELFEEVGILLARDGSGLLEGPLPPSAGLLRARITAGEPFTRVLAGAGLVPATDEVFSFARWITPITNPRRWDTRFLVGRAPRGQEPAVDGTETVSCAWFTPRAALAAYEAGKIMLIPPTVRTLDDLARFPSIEAVFADARQRAVRAVVPEIVQGGPEPAIRYPESTGRSDVPARRLVLRDGRWRPADG